MAPGLVKLAICPPTSASNYRIISQASALIVKHERQKRRSSASELSVLRVPVALEIGDQRRTEVTIGLLARVDGGVASKQIQRFLANPDGAPVADGADRASACEPLDDAVDRGVHLAGGRDLVADQAPLWTVAVQSALVEDGLSRHAIADEAVQAQIREAGNDTFLARGQAQERVRRGQNIIHAQQRLAMAADRERVQRGDP